MSTSGHDAGAAKEPKGRQRATHESEKDPTTSNPFDAAEEEEKLRDELRSLGRQAITLSIDASEAVAHTTADAMVRISSRSSSQFVRDFVALQADYLTRASDLFTREGRSLASRI